ncbi:MAG: septum site-determining protein MinC [Gammaproteobacteria bacterium]
MDSQRKPFELRAGMQFLTSLLLYATDTAAVEAELAKLVSQAPGMFRNAPIVLDLQALKDSEDTPDFEGLARMLRERSVVPVAVRNASPAHRDAARAAGWGVRPDARESSAPAEPKAESAPKGPPPARVIDHPVRSGQQIYAPGDLVLLQQVSPGAEVLAAGCIHIYAPLRGRALAGVNGDTGARIFCQALDAELVSVAGRYRTLDDLEGDLAGRPAQVHLDGERLVIAALG